MATGTWTGLNNLPVRSWSCCHYCSLCFCSVHIYRTPDYTYQPTHMRIGHHSQTRHSSSDHSLLLYVSYNSLHLPTLSMEWHYWKPLSAIYSYNLFLRYNAPFYYYPSLLGARIRWIICSHLPELCKSALLFSHGNFAEPFSSILPTCPLDTGGCASVPYLLDKLDSWRSSKLPFFLTKISAIKRMDNSVLPNRKSTQKPSGNFICVLFLNSSIFGQKKLWRPENVRVTSFWTPCTSQVLPSHHILHGHKNLDHMLIQSLYFIILKSRNMITRKLQCGNVESGLWPPESLSTCSSVAIRPAELPSSPSFLLVHENQLLCIIGNNVLFSTTAVTWGWSH